MDAEEEEDEIGFVKLDIVEMYPSIPRDLGMEASREYLDTRPEIVDNTSTNEEIVSTESIMELLEISLDKYFL